MIEGALWFVLSWHFPIMHFEYLTMRPFYLFNYSFPPLAYHLLICSLLQKLLLASKGILLLCCPGAPCAVSFLFRGRVVALVCCSWMLVGLGRWECMGRAQHPWMNHKEPVRIKPVICKVLSSQTSKKANDILNEHSSVIWRLFASRADRSINHCFMV